MSPRIVGRGWEPPNGKGFIVHAGSTNSEREQGEWEEQLGRTRSPRGKRLFRIHVYGFYSTL